MSQTLKTLVSSAALTALALACSNAMAHPGWVDGGGVGYTWKNNTATEAGATATPSARGFNVDAIRIGHGCANPDTGVNEVPVAAASWVWPKGLGQQVNANGAIIDGGLAPMSTSCDASGANCTGGGSQPSVARIPDSSKKAHLPEGQGAATTLAAELVDGTSTGPGTNPIGTLSGRMQFQGNLGYFEMNRPKLNGFYAKGNKFNAAEIAAMGVASAGAPYHNAVQVRWAQTQSTSSVVPMYFSATSCARKLVVRVAGADICHLSPSRAAVNDGHSANFWMGGPTRKFTNGHGVHENFWLGYTLLVRDTTKNPYPASCANPTLGDYDLVVMPTYTEIDQGLPFPGFANAP